MSEFLRKQMGFAEPVETEVIAEPVEVVEEVAPIEEAPAVIEEIAPVEEQAVVEAPAKIKVNFKEQFESKEQEIYNYLKEKNTDYSSLKAEDLVTLKFKQANPEFSEEDVKAELADIYGIGVEKIEINIDEMGDEEIAEAKLHNKTVDRLQRNLKKEAKQAENYFNEIKQGLQMPDLELELDNEAKPVADEQGIIQKYEEDYTKQIQEEKEGVWIPEVKRLLKEVDSIKKLVEFDDNGSKVVIEVDYKLTDEEKQQSLQFLSDHIVTPYDRETYADVQGLVQGKVAEMNYDKLLKVAIRDAYIKGRTDYVKDKVINYDDKPKTVAGTFEVDSDFARQSFRASASRRKQG